MSFHPVTRAWVPALLVFASLLPLGAVPAAAEHSIVVLVGTVFLAAAALSVRRNGLSGARAGLSADLDPSLLLLLPALPLVHWMLMRTFGLSSGPEAATLHAVARMAAFAALFALSYGAIGSRRAFRTVIACLVTVGAFEAIYGVLNLLSGNDYLLIYPREAYADSATGTLVSRNHFAFLMEMLLPLGIIAIASTADGDEGRSERDRGELFAKRTLLGACIAFQALALLLSRSRSGVVALVVATLLVIAVGRTLRPASAEAPVDGERPVRSIGFTVIAAGSVALLLALYVGLEPLLDRFLKTPEHLEAGRLPAWTTALAAAADRPLFGHGWGSFGSIASSFRPQPTGLSFEHAHSEYLEIFAESGLVGLALAGYLLLAIARRTARALAKPLTERQRNAVLALTGAITAVLLHSAVDFGLRVPGVAMTFIVVLALFFRVTADPALVDGETSTGRTPRR